MFYVTVTTLSTVKDNVGGNKPREDDHAEGSCIPFVSNNLI